MSYKRTAKLLFERNEEESKDRRKWVKDLEWGLRSTVAFRQAFLTDVFTNETNLKTESWKFAIHSLQIFFFNMPYEIYLSEIQYF